MNDENDKRKTVLTVQPLQEEPSAAAEEYGHVNELPGKDETAEEPLQAEACNEDAEPLTEEGSNEEEEQEGQNPQEKRKEEEDEVSELKAAIAEQAREDEQPQSSSFTLRKILGGDILSAHLFRSNIWLIITIVVFVIISISNRYSVQKYLIDIDRLNNELEDAKYRALSSSSQLTEKTRESHILEILKTRKDSVLKMSDRPPYIINVPDK